VSPRPPTGPATERIRRVLDPLSRLGPATALRRALADPAATWRYLRSSDRRLVPRHGVERPPTPTEVATFAADLGLGDRAAAIDAWLDLCDDARLHAELAAAFQSTALGPDKSYRSWRDLLYVVVRLLRPDVVVETGVQGGFSSALLLAALAHNDHGRLVSIDVGDTSVLPADLPDPRVGWVVPRRLRGRWDLRLGDSRSTLPTVLDEGVDLFFSDVPNEILADELAIAGDRLRPGAIVATSAPDGSDAAATWRTFAADALARTATATRWERGDERSTLCAGRLRAPEG
jgi:hypothetical protein